MNSGTDSTNKESKALTKHDVAMKLNSETSLTQPEAAKVLQIVLEAITQSLVSGGHVEFRDFGVFEVVTRKSRIGRNPNRPEDIVEIPTTKVLRELAEELVDDYE